MKTLIFLKFTFRGLLVYRDRWFGFSNIANTCGPRELFGRQTFEYVL